MSEVPLRDCGSWLSGGTPDTANLTYWGGEIPWITASSLKGRYLTGSERQLTEAGVEAGSRIVPKDTILFVVRGMSLKKEFRVGMAVRPVAFGQDCKALVPAEGIDPKYLLFALETAEDRVLRMVDETSHGTGRLQSSLLADLKVSLPPLADQRRIVEILDTIDETIQVTERVITKYERLMAGILQRASFGSLRAEGPTFALRDFCSLSAGLTPSRSISVYYGGDVPWVKSGEVAGSAILTTEETVSAKAVNDLGLGIVRSGTPLIAMYGATAGAVGWLEIDAATNQAVLAVEPEADRADRRWLYWALRLGSGRMLASVQGSGQPNLSKQIIGATTMSLPDFQEQLAEVERIDSAQASIEAQRAVVTKLRLARTGLAADLLSGRARTVAV